MKKYKPVIKYDRKTKQFYASVRSLCGCYSYAENLEELMKNIKEAVGLHLEVIKKKRLFYG